MAWGELFCTHSWPCTSAHPGWTSECLSLFVTAYLQKGLQAACKTWLIAIGKIESRAKVRFYLEETFAALSKTVDWCQKWAKNLPWEDSLMLIMCFVSPANKNALWKLRTAAGYINLDHLWLWKADSFEDKGHPCSEVHKAGLWIGRNHPPAPAQVVEIQYTYKAFLRWKMWNQLTSWLLLFASLKNYHARRFFFLNV